MQPILAESAPHRGRAIAFAAAALAVVATLALAFHGRPSHRDHHRLRHLGKCGQASYYLVR
jgi:hypothetical protein